MEDIGFQVFHAEHVPMWRKARGGKAVESAPMFPRYIFVSMDVANDEWWRVFQLRNSETGFECMLGENAYKPAPLPEGELECLVEAMGMPDIGSTVSLVGKQVRIVGGPFAEGGWNRFVGICELEKDDDRVRVLMSCFGSRETKVWMKREHVELAE
jgi:transcription antitermination factor NusG